MPSSIGSLVYNEIEAYKNKKIEIARGLEFNHYQTIKRINYYLHDKFLEREDGIFWNLATPRIPHFAKNIDLDTKDLMPYGVGETNFYQAWILKVKFKKWLEDNHFAILLNDLSEGLAVYGSVVWKMVEDENGEIKIEECDLERLYFDPAAKSIRDVPVIELHSLTELELREKEGIWDNVDKVLEKATKIKEENQIPEFEIWERWGEYKESKEKKAKYMHFIGYGKGDDEVILWKEEVEKDDLPYFDFHLGKYKKRWLRVGVVERLFILQERVNQLVNQNAVTTEIASLLLLRTADPEMRGNVLQQVESGQIINSPDLQQIVLQNPGISSFFNELAVIERQADKLCLTPEVVVGETMPSGTPFRSIAVLANAAKSSFRYIKERVGETIGYILKEKVLPKLIRKWNKGELLEIAEDEQDIKIYDQILADKMKLQYLLEANQRNYVVPNLEEVFSQIEEKARVDADLRGRKIEIPKGFFNFDYGIKFNITGEAVDKAQQNDAMYNALMMFMANPAIINIPLFKQYLENNNITWWRLTQKQLEDYLSMAQKAPPSKPDVIGPKKEKDQLLAQVDTGE
jgi:hypothetical protein